ncbi:hypothetical protein TNCV_3589071 [Trichonephila clavipes]|nr:hypothetical protein TNCV_3589071 [Trichonephila clavipes]
MGERNVHCDPIPGCGERSETEHVRRREGLPQQIRTDISCRQDRTACMTQIQRQFLLATERRVLIQTIRNKFHVGGLYTRRPVLCIPMIARHHVAKGKLDVEHRDWMKIDWGVLLFMKES